MKIGFVRISIYMAIKESHPSVKIVFSGPFATALFSASVPNVLVFVNLTAIIFYWAVGVLIDYVFDLCRFVGLKYFIPERLHF